MSTPNSNLLVSGSGSIFMQNLAVQGNSIIATNTNGSIDFIPNGTGTIGFGNVGFNNGVISTTNTDLDLVLAPNGTGAVLTDNLQLDGNTISTTDINGDLVLAPNGTGTVKTDNLQLDGNTISTTDINGDLVLAPNGTGNVGIGTSSPAANLDIGGNTDADIQAILTRGGDADFQLQAINSSSSNTSGAIVSKFGLRHGTNETALFNFIRGSSNNDGSLAIVTNNAEHIRVNSLGNVGLNTTDPRARLHINGNGSGTGLSSGQYRRFDYNSSGLVSSTGTWSTADMSIWALGSIISRQSIASHANGAFSDERIKKNITDINDGEALEIIRKIQPKKYEYKDIVMKGTKPVWGFIAQEVSSVLDYSTELLEKEIPNIYCNATIQGKTLTFQNFDTSNLIKDNEGNICKKLFLMSEKDTEVIVTINNIINSNSITILEDIEQQHLFENIIFVYGQYMKDFHVLKKDAIFTVAVAALQEVDRRQVADNERILELEGEVSFLKEENNFLKQQLASIASRLSAAGL